MKRALTIAILFAVSSPCFAGTGEAYVIGFGAGIAFKLIPFTNKHVALPIQRKIQRTVRPVEPQDSIEKANRKAEKAQRKEEKARRKAAQQRHEQN
jgi:hypothetical protein